MAGVELLGIIERDHGYHVCRQCSDILDALISRETVSLNRCAADCSRNAMKAHLALLIRRDTRLINPNHPILAL